MEDNKRKPKEKPTRKKKELKREIGEHLTNTTHPTFSFPYMGSLSLNSHQHDNYSSQKDELDGKRSQQDELDGNRSQEYELDGNSSQEYELDGNRSQEYELDGNSSQEYELDGNRSQKDEIDGNRSQKDELDGNSSQKDELDDNRQQDDHCKNFYLSIIDGSLKSAFEKYPPCPFTEGNSMKRARSVVIVGAGVSGLSAAFELEKEGYNTQVVELQNRVGGRTKTLRAGFSDGLHAEGGAMRIPENHFCTHGYIKKFGIDLRPFKNYNKETWLYLDGEKIKTEVDLYKRTFNPLKADVEAFIDKYGAHIGWQKWVDKWSKLSVNDFLRTTIGAELTCIYRPWPEIAIRGYQIATYSPAFDTSLVEYYRDELGQWWTEWLETPVDGMDTIAKHFLKPHKLKQKTIDLSTKISFGVKIEKVVKINKNKVSVEGRNVVTGEIKTFLADAVILTVPLTILRQMDIKLGENYRKAIGYINYQPSTKVALQCRTRFWEKEVGQGGFTKTDLPIGQLHYPCPNDPLPMNERGILVVYTWEQDALIFGSQPQSEAIESAVRQVSKIHPEMKNEFEVGMVQAWFSDNSAQGAYACLKPFQYNDGMKTLMTPDHPIYLAGEAISYTNGWIQGAIESGLNAAFHLYSYDHCQKHK